MHRLLVIITALFVLAGCQGENKALQKSIKAEFKVASEVVIDGNEVVVVLNQLPQVEKNNPYLTDYTVSSVVRNVLNTLGRTDFLGFTSIRVDVAPVRRTYVFPTKEYVKGVEKLVLIQKSIATLSKGVDEKSRKLFDESITEELFEEQILKEWNELMQWHGPLIESKIIGVKVLQLPSEVGYFLQIGGLVQNKNGDSALLEFLFESHSKKILSMNITYL